MRQITASCSVYVLLSLVTPHSSSPTSRPHLPLVPPHPNQTSLKSGWFRSCSLLVLQTGASSTSWLFLELCRATSAGSAVFEGPPVPLISPGTPRREWASSPGPPHCSVLFLYPRSLHSVKLRGTSSISPVPHVNRRFNQTLLSGLLPSPHQAASLGGKNRRRKSLG